MMSNNPFEKFERYVTRVLDTNHDGILSFSDFFPSKAIGIATIVIDLLVAVAEIRVWDVGMKITGGNWMLAIGFVAVSALPFYLGQILYLYPRATAIQQIIAAAMVLIALYTSATFGLADLSQQYNVSKIVSMVIWLTFAYVLGLIVYVATDNGIRANRLLTKTQAAADLEKQRLSIAAQVMESYRAAMQVEEDLESRFGEGAVQAQMGKMRGGKNGKKPDRAPAPPPELVYAAEEKTASKVELPNPTIGNSQQNSQHK